MLERKTTTEYLKISELEVGKNYKKVCLVTDARYGVTVTGTGYYTFYLKDTESVIISARMFSIEDFANSGYDARFFRNKPVLVNFESQIFKGQWSLIVHEISIYNGSFDYSLFNGAIKSDIKKLQDIYGDQMPIGYESLSIPEFCNGRVGGALKIFEQTTNAILGFAEAIDVSEILQIFNKSFAFYVNYLKRKQAFDLVTGADIHEMLQGLLLESNEYPALLDTCYAMVNMMPPRHIYTHVITNAFTSVIDTYNLIYTQKSMPKGMNTFVDGKELTNY